MKSPVGVGRFRSLLSASPFQEKQSRPIPIWFMRQAGRYLPEYRELKKKKPLEQVFFDEKFILDLTLQPLQRFDLDAAILFSDILILVPSLGLNLEFNPKPKVTPPLQTRDQFFSFLQHNQKKVPVDELTQHCEPVYEALVKIKQTLRQEKTLIGFAAAPFTLLSYLMAGEPPSSQNFTPLRGLLSSGDKLLHDLLSCLSDFLIAHLKLQIEAGADLFQIFESHSNLLSYELYEKIAFPYVKKIFDAFPNQFGLFFPGPSLHATYLAHQLNQKGLSVYWSFPIEHVVNQSWTSHLVLQGNLDPADLFRSEEDLHLITKRLLTKGFQHSQGLIFNLGHGVHPLTPLESVETVLKTVRQFEYQKNGC